MSDAFPTTQLEFLRERIGSDPTDARAHVLDRYFEPLCAFVRASRLRGLGEPAELVSEFLAARLSDDGYLARWTQSGLPLRRWLVNGLVIHARNSALAARRRDGRHADVDPTTLAAGGAAGVDDHDTDALLALERAWAVRTVTEAHERVRLELESEGRTSWWELFRLHSVHGMRYAQAAPLAGIPVAGAAGIHRQVAERLRAALRAILSRDGIRPDDVDRELAMMQDLLG